MIHLHNFGSVQMDEDILKKMTLSKCTYVSHPTSRLSEWLLVQINTCTAGNWTTKQCDLDQTPYTIFSKIGSSFDGFNPQSSSFCFFVTNLRTVMEARLPSIPNNAITGG